MELLKEFLLKELDLFDDFKYLRMRLFNDHLLKWNEKINVVSRNLESIENLILNSIFFLKKFPIDNYPNILDLGTGGGFPGIPLKILYPDINFTLIDSIKKKVLVVSETIKKLGLKKIKSVEGRAEELSNDEVYKGKYNMVISRAVASLNNIYDWGVNFLKENGEIVCIKGGNIEEEIKDFEKATGKGLLKIIDFNFPERYGIEDKKIVIITQKPTKKAKTKKSK